MKTPLIFLIGLILICASYFVGRKSVKPIHEIVNSIDTVFDTTTIIKPKPYKVKVTDTIIDTLISVVDSTPTPVIIPISTTVYKDSNYRAVISGYKSTLDSIQTYSRTIRINHVDTVKTKPKWGIGVSVGYGATKTGLSPIFSISLTRILISW